MVILEYYHKCYVLFTTCNLLNTGKGGRKGSTGVTRIRLHVVVPSPRKKTEKNTNANNELALAA